MIDSYLENRLIEIKSVCLLYNVSKLYAFGSIVDGRFEIGKSDIDFLVEFNQGVLSKKEISKNILMLWIQFQKILDSKVDIVLNNKIKGRYFKKYLELYKVILFDNQEI